MQYYAALSYGKDSLAMLEAIRLLGYPLDGIIHAEIWATDDIPGEIPEVVHFKQWADRFIQKRYGLKVERVCATDHDGSKLTFEKYFYRKPKMKRVNKMYEGEIYGFPFSKGSWCLRELKLRAQREYIKQSCYIGIAADEIARISNTQNSNHLLPLVEIGWSEGDCMDWCIRNNIVSPAYKNSSRGGCWFCPKQRLSDLRALYNEHPELWDLLMKWDNDSPVSFRSDGHTVHDYYYRFKAENEGLVPVDRSFRWSMLK